MVRIERFRVSVEREVPVVKVFARCVRLWLPDSHILWVWCRHRLSHCSHGSRESCHRCVHRSVRRLLTNVNHLCSELIELTSQHLNLQSRCHHHSISQDQEEINTTIPGLPAALPCKRGKPRKTCSSALCTVDNTCCFHVIRLKPKTSVHEKHVSVKSTVTGCDVTNCATTLQGFNKHHQHLYNSLWALLGRRLVCHCRDHQACHVDVLIKEFRGSFTLGV